MPFGMVGRMDPGIVGFKDRSMSEGNFDGECGAHHCNVARPFPNYSGRSNDTKSKLTVHARCNQRATGANKLDPHWADADTDTDTDIRDEPIV